MLEALRNNLIAMYCLRHGLATHEGRGVDALPGSLRSELTSTLITSTDHDDLRRVFGTLIDSILREAARQSLIVPAGLDQTLDELVRSAAPQ